MNDKLSYLIRSKLNGNVIDISGADAKPGAQATTVGRDTPAARAICALGPAEGTRGEQPGFGGLYSPEPHTGPSCWLADQTGCMCRQRLTIMPVYD